MTVLYIDSDAALTQFCQDIQDSHWLAIDTEFLREKTYYPQLCLIQIANDDVIACVDPIAVKDLTPLLDLLYQPQITLVFHAARQDLELLYLLKNALPQNLFDTQLAATILGDGDQIGYGNLVKQRLNVNLDKAHSRADWTQRPLSAEQLEYAADDVRYLRELYHQMSADLEKQQRTEWLKEDFSALANADNYIADPETIWRKIRGAGKLKGVQLAILQQLAAWLEQRAIDRDRPRRWIIKDEVMLDLARFAPEKIEKLSQIRGLEARDIERNGRAIIDVISKAKQTPPEAWPILLKPEPLSNQQEALIDALMALLRKFCDEQSVTPIAVASRKDIEKLVRGETELALLQGWRYQIVGHHLTAFIDGHLSVTADIQQIHTKEV
ncbi:MAG TPA: ribonuclease D [Methylophaga sp.]|nr:ribonuclease D [Methylophaga sp.]